ncbi:hypothetical protein PV326_005703 [Microctonus aethiopoides]|nr:hypothetical protein PV326_005703 [Microctonus aethiopoides]
MDLNNTNKEIKQQRQQLKDGTMKNCAILFTSPGFNVDGDTFSWSCIKIHKNGSERGINDEGDQEEEGEETEGAKEDEERSWAVVVTLEVVKGHVVCPYFQSPRVQVPSFKELLGELIFLSDNSAPTAFDGIDRDTTFF